MARRRMFSLDVVDTDRFLNLPISSQALYFHLGMRADDDGFIDSPRKITALAGCNSDDLRVLISKGFVIPFQSGVIVLVDWKRNNWIQGDRYHATGYQTEKGLLSENGGRYQLKEGLISLSAGAAASLDTECIQDVSIMDTEVRLGKDSIDKYSKRGEGEKVPPPKGACKEVVDLFNQACPSLPSVVKISENRKKTIKARLNTYSLDELKRAFEKAEASDFLKGKNGRNWIATFDWLLKDANLVKVLEGNYDNKEKEAESYESSCSVRLWH